VTVTTKAVFAIRQAVFADIDALSAMFDRYRQFYKRPTDVAGARAFLAQRFDHGESVVFLAEADRAEGQRELIGFTQLYPSFSSTSMGRVFVLNDLFVAESARRQGVAAALLKAAVDYGKAMGAVRVSLNTDVQNSAAQATYVGQGWVQDTGYYTYTFHLAP
jgi:GNAT superfamily N-acetyltransferase